MNIVTVTADIDATPASVWAFAGDFGGLAAWSRAVQDCVVEGQGVGAQRTITLANGKVRERLEEHDPAAMRIAYAVVSGSTLPVAGLRATIQLTALGCRGTRAEWRLDGDPKGDVRQVQSLLRARYEARLEELRNAVRQSKEIR